MEIDTRYDFPIDAHLLSDSNNTVSLQLGHIRPNTRVLELGCATGRVTRLLHDIKQCTVTGVEYSASAAQLARPFCESMIIGDLESQSVLDQIPSQQFDFILAGDVLEHLRDPEKLLVQLKRCLRTTGAWVISVPNIAHWSIRKNLVLGRFNYTETGLMDRTHVTWFTRFTLQKMIERAGYTLSQMDAVCTLPMQDKLRLQKWSARLHNKKVLHGLLGYQLVACASF